MLERFRRSLQASPTMAPGSRFLGSSMSRSATVASTAIFTAFVAGATMAFTLAIPANPFGYFNLGEVMVYICALLMGPYVGAVAGGAGSSIADIALGFPIYAPGTLVIKGTEGFIVGYLGSRASGLPSGNVWKAVSAGVGALVGLLLAFLGATFFSGSYQLTLGFPVGPQTSFAFEIPEFLWVGLGALVFIIVAVAGYRVDQTVGWTVFSVLVGGSAMFTGYFLYNYVVLAIGLPASAGEVPFDVGQALIGLIVSVPIASRVRRMGVRANGTEPRR